MLRMGVFISIAMFLLMPLLSSQVLAEQDCNLSADTDVAIGGVPSVTVNPPLPQEINYNHIEGNERINFYCSGEFSDWRTPGPGNTKSIHKVDLEVTQIEPPNGPSDDDSTGFNELEPQQTNIEYQVSVVIWYSKKTHHEWKVVVTAYCENFDTENWVEDSWEWTVTMD